MPGKDAPGDTLHYPVSAAEVLTRPTQVLQELSVRLAADRVNLKQRLLGHAVQVHGAPGHVAAVHHDRALVRMSDGAEKTLVLNPQRARQLLAGETTRK